ncbi:MAG: hypothetical protein ACRCXC_02445 [Legionella sp.]
MGNGAIIKSKIGTEEKRADEIAYANKPAQQFLRGLEVPDDKDANLSQTNDKKPLK